MQRGNLVIFVAVAVIFFEQMKFRIKFHSQTSSIIFDEIKEDSSIDELKSKLKKQFLALRKSNFHLSLNGKDSLDENQTISQSGLVHGDILYILNEINRDNSNSSMDQPLTLDEVQDVQTYPILIHRLLECSSPENELDYMVMIIHALMIESGFLMVSKSKRITMILISLLGFGE